MKTTKFQNIVHQETNLGIDTNMPANKQRCDNIMIRLQRCTTITSRCSDVLTIEKELQRYSNIAIEFNSRFISNVLLTTVLQR